jgi:hypothetical protein
MKLSYTPLFLAAALLLLPAQATAQARIASPAVSSWASETPARGGDVLRYHDPETDEQTVNTPAEGYVFGTNNFGDLAKMVGFYLPAGQDEITIPQVDVHLFRADSPSMFSYDLVFYSGYYDADGPEEELYRQTFEVEEIAYTFADVEAGPIEATTHVLDTPLTVDDAFFVGIEFEPGYDPYDLGMINTPEVPDEEAPSPYEWEQWSDGSWHLMSTAWSDVNGWHAWLTVYYGDPVTAGEEGAQAQSARLGKAFPNPFASSTQVTISVDEAQRVRVDAFDLLGRRVATLFDGVAAAGSHDLTFEAANLPTGLYILRMQGERFAQSRKVVLSR